MVVVCKEDATLVCLDAGLRRVSTVTLSGPAHEVVVHPGGRLAYLPLYGTGGVGRAGTSGDGIDVVDLHRGHLVGTIPLPHGSRPHDAAWGADGRLHLTAEGLSGLLSVDARTGTVLGLRPLGHPQGHMLAVTADGGRAYVAHVAPGSLTEIDLESGAVRHLGLSSTVNRVTLSRDQGVAYVADQESPRLAVVDLEQMTLRAWIPLPAIAFGTTLTTDPRGLVMALRGAGRLGVLDLMTHEVVTSTQLPRGPQRVVVDRARETAYATCSPAGVVVAVNLRSMAVIATSEPGQEPDGMALLHAGDRQVAAVDHPVHGGSPRRAPATPSIEGDVSAW